MTDVFISYTRDDRPKVEALAQALEARGFDVWWDSELLPGQRYAQEIDQHLSTAAAVIVVWSQNSVGRNWVLDEAAVGRDRGVLTPVLVDPVDPPLGFRQVQALDLTAWPDGPGGAAAFERLAAAIEAKRGAAPARPPAPPAAAARRPAGKAAGRVLAGAVAALALGAGWLAYDRLILNAGPPPVVEPPDLSTDSPGASADFGLNAEELNGFGAQDLIRLALSNTSIDAIEEAAAAGAPLGQAFLCLARVHGEGVAQDLAAGRTACEAAATAGQPLAQFVLSGLMRRGEAGFEADAAGADALLAQAAAAGDPRALTEQARQAIREGRPAEAAAPARAAAALGHHPAEILLGWMHENGEGAPRNAALAFQWYDQAAQTAYPAALTATGRMLENGEGVLQDAERAFDRYAEAAAQGDAEAAYRLSGLYERGVGAPADAARALALMQQALDAGYPEAAAGMARLRGEPAPAETAAAPEEAAQ